MRHSRAWRLAGRPVGHVLPTHRQRLVADDGTLVQAEHLPPASGSRDLAIVVAHGFMLHSRHPRLRRIAEWMRDAAGVVLVDLRGHGGSGGVCTLGWQEVRDVEAAVGWARWLGYRKVATLGFSLGAAVVLRHAALYGRVDRVAAVSGPGQWYFRGTPRMRLLHQLILSRTGRFVILTLRRTRITNVPWSDPFPIDPVAAASQIEVPLLVVHGDRDDLFPADHAHRVSAASRDCTLWLVPGFGHAEIAMDASLARQVAHWLADGKDPGQRAGNPGRSGVDELDGERGKHEEQQHRDSDRSTHVSHEGADPGTEERPDYSREH